MSPNKGCLGLAPTSSAVRHPLAGKSVACHLEVLCPNDWLLSGIVACYFTLQLNPPIRQLGCPLWSPFKDSVGDLSAYQETGPSN